MVQYRIQNLLSYLPPSYIKHETNPNRNALEAEYVAWIDSLSFFSDAHKKAWKDAGIPLFACRVFPESDQGTLRICVQYLMVSSMIETLTDAPSTISEAQKWVHIFKQAFKQTLMLGENEEIAGVLKHLVDQVLNAIKAPYQSYLVESNIQLAEGMLKEASDRKNHDTKPTLETYLKTRRNTIGIRPVLDIGRWIHKVDISPEVLMHPDVVKLEERFVDVVFITNDLYSYKKEMIACGAYHNYITIALGDPITGLREDDRQGAIDYTCRKFCEFLEDFERQAKTLPSFGENEDVNVGMYIKVMKEIIVGNIQWSLEVARYGHFGVAGAPNWGDVVFDIDSL